MYNTHNAEIIHKVWMPSKAVPYRYVAINRTSRVCGSGRASTGKGGWGGRVVIQCRLFEFAYLQCDARWRLHIELMKI